MSACDDNRSGQHVKSTSSFKGTGAILDSISHDKSKITLISLHGLIRGNNPELGRDADTGGQVIYVLELARELAKHPDVREVELLTRQIVDDRVSSDYAQLEEKIAENAKIVRIPFGPNRYLRKELLWPYIDIFVDQTLSHFKRAGLPDIIHGHYADAGLAGARLARLLHIPYIFTGHSLGRVKRERLLAKGSDAESIERKYNISARIEAEEVALETATMVVTSTSQEVEEQYKLYEQYDPGRMEVIPPGVDLSNFSPTPGPAVEAVKQKVKRFLNQPEKPIILTIARLDERKNLEMLVRVFGESERLQEIANLVIVLGTRSRLANLTKPERKIFNKILCMIDDYDLYGKVAYPKTLLPGEVPEFYRLAAATHGVFVNPALTEPFGLTLLEAAGTGLPIVATNDGGPRDIVANCQNGLLIDPLDAEEIENTLLCVLTDEKRWMQFSKRGLAGAHQHYSWAHHADRYLRSLKDILKHSDKPVLASSIPKRRLPEFQRLIMTDLDNTLTGDAVGLQEFLQILRDNDDIGFGIATGRCHESAINFIRELELPAPDVLETAAGTELYYGEDQVEDVSWRRQIDFHWKPDEIRNVMEQFPGITLQSNENQSEFKVSYELNTEVAPDLATIRKAIRQAKLRANLIFSLGMYLDIIPVRGGCGNTLRHLLYKWGFSPEQVLVAGDSGNDEGMLKGRTLGVVVGNYSPELNKLRKFPRIYFAEAEHARGIIEGINYYHFLGHIQIPNDDPVPVRD